MVEGDFGLPSTKLYEALHFLVTSLDNCGLGIWGTEAIACFCTHPIENHRAEEDVKGPLVQPPVQMKNAQSLYPLVSIYKGKER